jgi:hypothetical protein
MNLTLPLKQGGEFAEEGWHFEAGMALSDTAASGSLI